MNRVDQAFKERFYLKREIHPTIRARLSEKEKYSNDPEQVERITRIQNILQYNLEIYQNIYKDFGMKKPLLFRMFIFKSVEVK